MDKLEESPDTAPLPPKKPYEKPVLRNLGSLRDLTMTKVAAGNNDGKSKRFTGRGGHHLHGDRRS